MLPNTSVSVLEERPVRPPVFVARGLTKVYEMGDVAVHDPEDVAETLAAAAASALVVRHRPSGFTKVSALGVEEQRVNVVLDFADPAACVALGDAYRVEVRITIAEAHDALKVPTSALFRVGDAWAVYVAREGRARLTPVALGLRTGQEAEVVAGLTDADRVIVHPGDLLTDGARIAVTGES